MARVLEKRGYTEIGGGVGDLYSRRKSGGGGVPGPGKRFLGRGFKASCVLNLEKKKPSVLKEAPSKSPR